MWLVLSWPKPGAAAKLEPSQEREECGCPGLCWAGGGKLAYLTCAPSSLISFPLLSPSPILSSQLPFLPYPSQCLIFSLLPPGSGLLTGIGEGVWVRHRQTFPIFYFTSPVFILMGIREKPHKQLAHQGFISWTLLLRVRQIGK